VVDATVERNHTVDALRRKMGKPDVLLGTSRLLVFCGQLSGCDNMMTLYCGPVCVLFIVYS